MEYIFYVMLSLLFLVGVSEPLDEDAGTGSFEYSWSQFSYTSDEGSDAFDYNWLDWGPWTNCSRSCGGGVSRQIRICSTEVCQGSATHYKTCNIQPCPEGQEDYRTFQCDFYKEAELGERTYDWVPVSPLPHKYECTLVCRAVGTNITRSSHKVLDGTGCRKGSRDLCLSGECVSIGCDYQFNSTTRLDKCLVCGGDNSTCKQHRGKVAPSSRRKGREDLLEIPAGSFQIKVSHKGLGSALGIRTVQTHHGINQQRLVGQGGNFTLGNLQLQFGRIRSGRQFIIIPGKTDENIYVTVLRYKNIPEHDPDDKVIYQYMTPFNFIWKSVRWSQCSLTCAGGTQKMTHVCVDVNNNEIVSESNCEQRKPEDITRRCNEDLCPARWKLDPWTPCTKSCGQGSQVRQVHCIEEGPHRAISYVTKSMCHGVIPSARRSCNIMECPHWFPGSWSECSATCGTGYSVRNVTCQNAHGVALWGCNNLSQPHDSKRCVSGVLCFQEPERESEQPITILPPYSVELRDSPSYSVSAWSLCTATCGHSVRTRFVSCKIYIHKFTEFFDRPEEECHRFPKPSDSEECIMEACPIRNGSDSVNGSVGNVEPTRSMQRTHSISTERVTRIIPTATNFLNQEGESQSESSSTWIIKEIPSESSYSVQSTYANVVSENPVDAPPPSEGGSPSELGDSGVQTQAPEMEGNSDSASLGGFIWTYKGYHECSATCGGGWQDSRVVCIDILGETITSDDSCVPSEKLTVSRRECNDDPCRPNWEALLYNDCSMSCGGGLQHPLRIQCMQTLAPNSKRKVSAKQCEEIPTPGPRKCNSIDCSPMWIMHMWSDCSAPCGSGTRSRWTGCMQLMGSGEEVRVESHNCPGNPPPTVQPCNQIDCPSTWITGVYSQCSTSCGVSEKSRAVLCSKVYANGTAAVVDHRQCAAEDKPVEYTICANPICIEASIRANYSQFTQTTFEARLRFTVGQTAHVFPKTTIIVRCPVTGIKKSQISWMKGIVHIPRNTSITTRVITGGSLKIVNAEPSSTGVYKCIAGKATEKFYLTVKDPDEPLNSPPRIDYEWQVGEWGDCSVSCDTGFQRRQVICEHANRRGSSGVGYPELCRDLQLPKPADVQGCTMQDCSPWWIIGDWSECLGECRSFSTGIHRREVSCSSSNGTVLADASCDQETLPNKEKYCQTDLCIPRWHISKWGACSASCGEAYKKRKKKCMYLNNKKVTDSMFCRMNPDVVEPNTVMRCKLEPCPDHTTTNRRA